MSFYPRVCPTMADQAAVTSEYLSTKSFIELPDDILFLVFSKCDKQSLGRLCLVCHKLKSLIQSDCVWLRYGKMLLLIGSPRDYTVYSAGKFNVKEHCRISDNWETKTCTERILFKHNPRQLPWIQYKDDTLWISTQNVIRCFKLHQHGQVLENRQLKLCLQSCQDVSRFTVKSKMAVSGCRDGSVHIFDCENGSCVKSLYNIHSTDTQTVDFHGQCIITGSRDHTVKVLSDYLDSNNNPVRASVDIGERVWSVSLDQTGKSFTVGTSGCHGNSPLSVWDTERCEMLCYLGNYRHGAGVLDMKFEDPQTLLTCGYDANLCMWDIRSGQCILKWQEPYDTTLYCLQTDNHYAIVTGTARYGMMRLWDKRKKASVQEYFLQQKSPVYSIAFNCTHLYAALDLSVNVLDFSVF